MARPLKESLDYFPLDIDFDQDDKLVVPIAKYGMQGLGIIVKLMMNIYRNGYFYPWEEREQYALASKVNVDINSVIGVVNECIKWGFFNQKVYDTHKVLTSRGFQKRYVGAAKRRKSISFREDWVLIDPAEECENVAYAISIVDADGNLVNEYINPDKCNAGYTGIHKVKESKVKESKVKESKDESKEDKRIKDTQISPDGDSSPPNPYRFYENGFGTISPVIRDNIDDLSKEYGDLWLCEAMKIAILRGKRNLKYVHGILKSWHADGIDEPWTKEKPPNTGKGRIGQKTSIDVIQPSEEQEVSEEEVKEALRLAEKMQSGKQGGGQR
ncbi:DUF4373 domain-containing protein [Paenibacillus kribbensis]|uniref:Lin1244/Lin1753 domain-containing protein n=1 Tax=Paenibacillus kribbensis TaxID=172713 RepID=UPI002DBFE95D|nr:Lin1244/Lin1753 domain-containing protein [Paenibacillus kribbensis]MEC0234042.1 DUF4373 domain-containing protein [Paenibacillus kribbensis]